jgi:geranylgeranyl diphosphate synthase type I
LGVWGEEAVTGKSTSSDIRRKKQTLPVVFTLASRTPAAAELARLYATPELSDEDVDRAASLLEECGARKHATHLAERTFEEAVEVLAGLPLGAEARRDLDEMGRFLLEREK